MTRRDFIGAAGLAAARSGVPSRLLVPVHRITDARAQVPRERLHYFWSSIWPEAYNDFSRGGIVLQTTDGPGEIRHTAADRPVFTGLCSGVINLILTGHLPLYWDSSRALPGGSALWDGYAVCVIALRYAHGNRMPCLSVNTCVHEILHVLLQDIFVRNPSWRQTGGREFRADWYATRLWLFGDSATLRESAQACISRLRRRTK